MLERMRMIDQANAWSQGTHQNYQAHLGKLNRFFQQAYGVPILVPTEMKHLPRHPSVGIMWAQQHYCCNMMSITMMVVFVQYSFLID
jgi:hypothetical protein